METISNISPYDFRCIISREVAEYFSLVEGTKIRDEELYLKILFINCVMTKMSNEALIELDKIVKESSL